jgi:hypothetical protein
MNDDRKRGLERLFAAALTLFAVRAFTRRLFSDGN